MEVPARRRSHHRRLPPPSSPSTKCTRHSPNSQSCYSFLERGGVTGYDTDTTYRYDDAGNVKRIADTAAGRTPDVQCFTYDGLRQLTKAWTTPNSADTSCDTGPSASTVGGPYPYWQSFTYDDARNRKTETQHGLAGAADVTRTYNYPSTGQPRPHAVQTVVGGTNSLGFEYDAAGNTVSRSEGGKSQTSEYDYQGHLSKVTDEAGKVTSFLYDADGARLIRRAPDATTLYLPGMEVRKAAGTGAITATRYYTHAGRTVATQANDKKLHWLTGDHNGTAMTAINAVTGERSRRYYTPFGTQRGAEGVFPGERGYVGGTNDATTGLVHLGAREYDPSTGRFTTVDPVLEPNRPASLNAYAYADNSPITYADPTGEKPHCGTGCEYNPGTGKVHYYDNTPCKKCLAKQQKSNGGSSGSDYARDKEAARRLQSARIAAAEAKAKVISAAKALVQIAADELGITDALDCFTKGDLGACGATALNVAASFVGGLAGKLLAKYGAPWKWKQGAALLKRIWNLGGDLVNGAKEWWRTSRRVKQLDCNSFVPGARVVMADGKRKPIKDVRVGDRVLATDPVTGKTSAELVTAEIVGHGTKHLVKLTVDVDGKKGGKTATITATDGHPFWTPKQRAWVDAGHLTKGTWLQTSAGTWVQITATRKWTAHHATVHNLTVNTHHTYYISAGAGAVLVHNTGGLCGRDNNYAYPKQDGFDGPPVDVELPGGHRFDRYGYDPTEDGGEFASPEGTPFAMRALSKKAASRRVTTYEVVEPFTVQTGIVRPWFGQPGGGFQYHLPAPVNELLKSGRIRVAE
ncbi:MAG: DUF4237 domain-containing protein [Streptosporangiales bacterium]|nr:DUF4237 domain-containing protein [Streptosporangiales bacterium]